LGTFAEGGGLDGPTGHTFSDTSGNLFVSSLNSNTVIEYDGATGIPVRTYESIHFNGPEGIAFGPDGNMWVSNNFGREINEFDSVTGDRIRQVSGFRSPASITVKPGPESDCLTLTVKVLIAGQSATWNVSGASSGARVVVVNGFQYGTTIINHKAGYCAIFGIQGIDQKRVVGTVIADADGNAILVRKVSRNLAGLTVFTQAAEQGTCPDQCVSNLDIQVVQ